ncbi:MAG TPA: alpha/beta hydrolase domain-containing protein [Bryobacteraceae bacterium]|nr:alpha/beta hydrolase domain-containing protein [Bryobacteraceae bacterium]
MIARVLVVAGLLCGLIEGAVARLEVLERSDVQGGKPFGAAGPYERLAGRAWFAIDPALAQNRIVADLEYAPRNPDGKVAWSADFVILRPRDAQRGNSSVLLEIVNRGNSLLLGFFDFANAQSETGDGFLLEHGYTLAWVGWQWDVPDKPGVLRLSPVVASAAGKPIEGLVRAEYTPDHRVDTFSLADRDMTVYPALDTEDPALTLTVRDRVEGPRKALPRSAWQFAPGARAVRMPAGFEPGHIYELVYRAQDPVVAGLGPAAVRDFVSFLKYGAPGVPERRAARAIGFGVSQSGRFLRSFLYWGFNQDEAGRKVFDGVMAHVAGAGRGSFNHRFAQPSRDAQPIANTFYPTDVFPFTDLEETDAATGASGSLLGVARKAGVVPKIFYTNSAYEYYGRAASLIHTTPDGAHDAPLAPETRIYFFAGTQHGPAPFPPGRGLNAFAENPADFRWSMRALLEAMNNWIAADRQPPPSTYPTLEARTLVAPGDVRFPKLPGVAFPRFIHKAYRVDYGPEFATRGIVTIEPPRTGPAFPTLVPQVDADGNDLGGIRMPEVAVPLATFTGWNLRAPAAGAPDERGTYTGSWLPFARTRQERERAGDSRPSIAERYLSRAEYLDRVKAAAQSLSRGGFLLEADLDRIVERSAAEWDYAASR